MENNALATHMYMLHQMPYKNNSLIVTLLGEKAELIRGIYHGGRKKNLSLFTLYWVSYREREGLSLLQKMEAYSNTMMFKGDRLFCALYINELLVKLLRRYRASRALLKEYQALLQALIESPDIEPLLRQFERNLLKILGYEIEFNRESFTSIPIKRECHYIFEPTSGFVSVKSSEERQNNRLILGEDILSIHHNDYRAEGVRQVAKRVMRQAFHYLLQGTPLVCRDLFAKQLEETSA